MLRFIVPHRRAGFSTIRRFTTACAEANDEAALKRAERTMTRFWKQASVKHENDACTVMLDHRQLRTPGNNIVTLPSQQRLLAFLTASEWESQKKILKAHALPLTSILARAYDALDDNSPIRLQVVDKLMTYLDTDAICYHEEHPEILTQLQDTYWKSLLAWVSDTFAVQINTTTEIFAVSQPEETKTKLRAVVEQMDAFELAAFEKSVMSTKSFLTSLALVKGGITVEHAARAAHVEMLSQMDRWGEVEDSHDVEQEYIRQTLGSVACVVMNKM